MKNICSISFIMAINIMKAKFIYQLCDKREKKKKKKSRKVEPEYLKLTKNI